MPHSFGYRARTRHMFSRPFGESGTIKLSTYMKPFKMGDYVDISANGAIHKGMPHKYYQGKTGRVFNVTKRAIGVEINKQVRQRIIVKRVNVRIEHVQASQCRKDFLERAKKNDEIKREAKITGKHAPESALKRLPRQPKTGFSVRALAGGKVPVVKYPVAFVDML